MSQFSFLEPLKVVDSLLVMLVPPPDVVEQLKSIRALLMQQYRFTQYEQERPHVTLHHIGEYDGLPERVISDAKNALASVKALPFEIEFDYGMSFGHGAFVLRAREDNTQLLALRQQLGDALIKAGLGRNISRGFTPHMTLFHENKIVPEQAINKVNWTVTEFALVNSRQRKSEHIHLAKFPLRG